MPNPNSFTGPGFLSPEKNVSRRSFGKLLGLVLAPPSLFITQDSIKGEFFWAGTYPEVHEVYSSQERTGTFKRGAFVLPGFNVANLKHGTEAQLPALKETNDYVAHVTYGNNGFDIRDIYRSVRQQAREQGLERVMFAGQSAGGMVAIDLAERLFRDGIITDRIFFYSTPLDFTHIQPDSQKVIASLAKLDHPLLRLGPDTRFGAEFGRQIYAGEPLGSALANTREIMEPSGCSNALLETIASYMASFKLADYAGRLPLETQYVYMCTSEPQKDMYVDVTKPPAALLSTLFGNAIILSRPDVGHADITVASEGFRAMTLEGIARCDYYDYMHSLHYPQNASGQ